MRRPKFDNGTSAAIGILALVAGIISTIALLTVKVAPAVTDPLACTGYPEPRSFIEAQDWWEPIPELGGLGHIHAGACFPVGQRLSGMLGIDLRVVFHGNHGTLLRIKVEDAPTDTLLLQINPNYTPPSGVDTTVWYGLNVDTRKMADGWRLLRIHVVLEHANGNLEDARPIMPVYIDNGKTDSNANSTWIKPTAWYKEIEPNPDVDWSYLVAEMKRATFPTGPVSGVWRPYLKAERNGNISAATPAIARSEVFIDPDFHHGSEGIVVLRANGALDAAVPIDTATLTNGPHKLVFVVTQLGPDGKRHSAVGSFPFTVANP